MFQADNNLNSTLQKYSVDSVLGKISLKSLATKKSNKETSIQLLSPIKLLQEIENLSSQLNGSVSDSLNIISGELDSLTPSLRYFEKVLSSARAVLPADLYQEAITVIRESNSQLENLQLKSRDELQDIVNFLLTQAKKSIDTLDANNATESIQTLISTFYKSSGINRVSQILPAINRVSTLFKDGSTGKKLIESADTILSGAIAILETEINKFDQNVKPAETEVKTLFEQFTSAISGPISVTSNKAIDQLSALTSEISSTYANLGDFVDGLNKSSNYSSIPRSISSHVRNTAGILGLYGLGYNSQISGIAAQNAITHPRVHPTESNLITDTETVIESSTADLNRALINALLKMPKEAVKDPQLANGPSLTAYSQKEAISNRASAIINSDQIINLRLIQ